MVDTSEVECARAAFEAVNRNKPETADIDKALEYLESAKFYDKLNSEEERNQAFQEKIIKTFTVMLTDIEEVRAYLIRSVGDSYDWYMNETVEKKLKQMAEAKYDAGGCDKALEKIDSMEVTDLKHYLKDLIKLNMVVGMEIIKDK